MKRKFLSMLLATAMVASVVAGCGSKTASEGTGEPQGNVEADTNANGEDADVAEVADAADEGKVLNIYCWNEEFKSRVKDHYPGYEEVDATHGKIGDVSVVWSITPSDDNAYQNNLDAALLEQANAAADEKIDLFLIEADYALKYVDTEYTMPVADLGITDDDLVDQYQYTKDIVTTS